MLFYNVITDLHDNILFRSDDVEVIDNKKNRLLEQGKKIKIYLINDMFNFCELVFTNE